MHNDEDSALLSAAESITDRTPVDWEAWRASRPELRGKLEHLRLIEEVAHAHRTADSAEASVTPAERSTDPAHRPAGPPAQRPIGDGGHPDLLTTVVTPPTEPVTAGLTRSDQAPSLSTWGPLKILERLGGGGFGEVYRALDPTLEREVALKLRRVERGTGDAPKRFIQEARRLARVRHPNVLVVHGADIHDGRAGLWTDLLRGKTLEQALAEQGSFGAHEAALIGIDLCRALAAVHAAGLVHRDVKTSNVMREQGGRIVLMDFGSVAERPRGGGPPSEEDPASGTPLFMAPEHLIEDRPASPTSDVYSLGVVLYRVVSGRFPVEAESWPGLIEKHRRCEPVPLRDVRPDLPTTFVQVVERASDPDPRRRYQSAGAMERALAASVGLAGAAEAASVAPAAAPEPTTAGAPTTSSLRCWVRRIAWVAGSALAVTATLALVQHFRPATGPFTVDAALFRQTERAAERLEPGAKVRPGDRLFMEVQGAEEIYVYVLNEDEKGEVFVLFPARLDLTNPLPSGARSRLPGRVGDQQMTWEVTSAGGRETFLVIASRRPMKELDRNLSQMPRAEQGRQVAYAPVSPESLESLRGVGGLVPAPTLPSGGQGSHRLSDIVRTLSAGAARDSGIWTWEIQLENPDQ